MLKLQYVREDPLHADETSPQGSHRWYMPLYGCTILEYVAHFLDHNIAIYITQRTPISVGPTNSSSRTPVLGRVSDHGHAGSIDMQTGILFDARAGETCDHSPFISNMQTSLLHVRFTGVTRPLGIIAQTAVSAHVILLAGSNRFEKVHRCDSRRSQ